MRLLPPVQFRVCKEDRERYGDQWYVYDEAALLRIPAKELVEIERTIGMSVATMLARARGNYADANLAATWVARRLSGVKEPFGDYQPLVLLIDWELPGQSREALLARRELLLVELEELDERLANHVEEPVPAGDADPPERTSSTSPTGE